MLPKTWESAVPFLAQGKHLPLLQTVEELRASRTIFPPYEMVFSAFSLTSLCDVRVVIVGQDPYHGAGQAHGLAFSVPDGVKIPPSLRNIFKEIGAEFGDDFSSMSTDLTRWAKQGVLLLNTTLTVEEGKPASHAGIGWQEFTDDVIRTVSDLQHSVVFLLWGKHAQEKASLIDAQKHLVLQAAHPSPFSAHRGFFGCNHFIDANRWLVERKFPAIVW